DGAHMGRVYFRGAASKADSAEACLDGLITRRVRGMQPGQVRYGLVTNDGGGILDDILVYRKPESVDGDYTHWLVVNASNREKILNWISSRPVPSDVVVDDRTEGTAMIAVQGPRSAELLTPLFGRELLDMKYYTSRGFQLAADDAIVSRTGYTGEDGWELEVPATVALDVWQQLVDRAAPLGGGPAG